MTCWRPPVSKKTKQRKPNAQDSRVRRIRKGLPAPLVVGLVIVGLTVGLYGVVATEKGHEKHAAAEHAADHGGLVSTIGHKKYELVFTQKHVVLYVSKIRPLFGRREVLQGLNSRLTDAQSRSR